MGSIPSSRQKGALKGFTDGSEGSRKAQEGKGALSFLWGWSESSGPLT